MAEEFEIVWNNKAEKARADLVRDGLLSLSGDTKNTSVPKKITDFTEVGKNECDMTVLNKRLIFQVVKLFYCMAIQFPTILRDDIPTIPSS